MPTVGAEINRRVSEILKVCMELQKFGVDAFFECCGTFLDLSVYLKGYLCSAENPDKVFFVALTRVDLVFKELQEIKTYLTALLKKHSKSVHAI